jgi:hypothetical protein
MARTRNPALKEDQDMARAAVEEKELTVNDEP